MAAAVLAHIHLSLTTDERKQQFELENQFTLDVVNIEEAFFVVNTHACKLAHTRTHTHPYVHTRTHTNTHTHACRYTHTPTHNAVRLEQKKRQNLSS